MAKRFVSQTGSRPFNHESTHTRYYTALLVTVLIVPLITVCILQTITLLKLRDDEMESFRTRIANKRHKKRNKMLLKMSVVIALAFALCWLPCITFQFLLLFFPSSIPQCSLGITMFIQFAFLFSLCHRIMNPSMYLLHFHTPDLCCAKNRSKVKERQQKKDRKGNNFMTFVVRLLEPDHLEEK